MDSAHSGSVHSSSGGDDEFDSSRGQSFLNPFLVTHQNPTFFDPHEQVHSLDHAFRQSNGNDNNNLVWSTSLRSQHNYADDFGNITSSSSLPLSRAQSLAGDGPFPIPSPSPSLPLRAETESQAARASLGLNQTSSVVIKNPKKRTRASRRAPTTVLKTDTANFRQMVQEFTGIPADPFSASPYSRRPDLFSTAAALRPGTRFDPLGPIYPVRPSPQKGLSPFSPPLSLLNSNMIDSTVPTTNIVSTNTTAAAAVAGFGFSTSNNSNNYPFPPQLGGTAAMNFGNLSGFQSEEITASAATVRTRDSDNLTR
ncbi:hypothetical protein Salat_0582000 [Sesamum alatum]|uniref:VQ domain-containing protein n=1 Tax=Sesamum alatum TaxID=300844 RepID=A0AAE2CTS4_9LAMI|nr:hypothetical protein Salat_0582000 [Sesamum alatum]